MNIDKNTKLKELMTEYPWLLDEAEKVDGRFKMLNNPIGKAFMKHATIEDLSKRGGIEPEEIINWLNQFLEGRQ